MAVDISAEANSEGVPAPAKLARHIGASHDKSSFFYSPCTGARLAQSVEHETLNLRVVGSSPTLGELFTTPPRVLL